MRLPLGALERDAQAIAATDGRIGELLPDRPVKFEPQLAARMAQAKVVLGEDKGGGPGDDAVGPGNGHDAVDDA